jgi:hypothetical protein
MDFCPGFLDELAVTDPRLEGGPHQAVRIVPKCLVNLAFRLEHLRRVGRASHLPERFPRGLGSALHGGEEGDVLV